MLVNTSEFKATVPALLFDPGFYVFDFDAGRQLTKFLLVEETTLVQAPFIDIRIEPFALGQFWVDSRKLFELEGLHDIPRARPVFIFHHAFVCSTLLARCLDQIDAFFSLKEPWILRRLADHKRAQGEALSGARWEEMFGMYVRLLCRSFRSGRNPVIKATNVANNLLVDVLRLVPDHKILYLHSDLRSFLISNLKKPRDTQQKMPGLARAFLQDSDFPQRYPGICDTAQLSFLRVCALIWLVNLYTFRHALEACGSADAKTLDAADMLTDLPGTLDSLSRYFGHAPDAAELQRMSNSRITGTNAKDPSMPYGSEQRRIEMEAIGNRFESELADAMAWIEPVVRESRVLDYMHARRLLDRAQRQVLIVELVADEIQAAQLRFRPHGARRPDVAGHGWIPWLLELRRHSPISAFPLAAPNTAAPAAPKFTSAGCAGSTTSRRRSNVPSRSQSPCSTSSGRISAATSSRPRGGSAPGSAAADQALDALNSLFGSKK